MPRRNWAKNEVDEKKIKLCNKPCVSPISTKVRIPNFFGMEKPHQAPENKIAKPSGRGNATSHISFHVCRSMQRNIINSTKSKKGDANRNPKRSPRMTGLNACDSPRFMTDGLYGF